MDFLSWYENNRTNSNWPKMLRKIDLEIYSSIHNVNGRSWAEKAFMFLINIEKIPLCFCKKPLKFYLNVGGYTERCSAKCSSIATAQTRSKTLKNKSIDEKLASQQKAKETSIVRYGQDYAIKRAKKISKDDRVKIEQSRKKAMIEKYGFINPLHIGKAKAKWQTTYHSRSKEQRNLTREKLLKTRIVNGTSIPDHHPLIFSSLKTYTRRVRYLTNKNIDTLDLFAERSKILHVDHRVSIFDGYTNKIPPVVIANPCNLELMSRTLNSEKNSKSSISINDLYELIEDKGSNE